MTTNGNASWYQVRFDDHRVYRSAQPSGGDPWADDFAWDAVMRVCLEVEDFLGTDTLYVFTRDRPDSYALPLDAAGALDLLQELIRRNLFDADLAIHAATVATGLFCWPDGEPH